MLSHWHETNDDEDDDDDVSIDSHIDASFDVGLESENNLVEDTGEKAISTKSVITEKCNPDGTKRTKARLVARGFEEQLIDKRFDSPTASRQSLRLVFMAASTMEWDLHSLDIASAFLQGKEIDRRVLVKPSDELMEERKLWKLKRCLYGLSDTPRKWYNKVEEKLTEL
eukprot:gene6737-7495_t